MSKPSEWWVPFGRRLTPKVLENRHSSRPNPVFRGSVDMLIWLAAKTYANGVVGIVSNAAAMARSKAMFSSSRLVPSSMVVP